MSLHTPTSGMCALNALCKLFADHMIFAGGAILIRLNCRQESVLMIGESLLTTEVVQDASREVVRSWT